MLTGIPSIEYPLFQVLMSLSIVAHLLVTKVPGIEVGAGLEGMILLAGWTRKVGRVNVNHSFFGMSGWGLGTLTLECDGLPTLTISTHTFLLRI